MSLRPVTAKLNMARRTVLNRDTVREVLLGDKNGQCDPPEIGYHWGRLPTGADENGNASYGAPFRIRANPAGGYLPRAGRRVFIALRKGAWVVQGPSLDDLEQAGIDSRSLIAGTPEQAYIYLSDVVNLGAIDLLSGLIVSVRELIYEINRTIKIWRGTDATLHFDLTSYRPTDVDTHLFALLVFNITKHLADVYPLEVYAGTAISLFTELDEVDLQTCYAALPTDQVFFGIKAFYLEYGQTEIAGPAHDVDVRQFINVPQPLAIPDDFITTDMIADGAITLPKLAASVLHTAATAPTINDDSGDGYGIGSRWIDTATDKEYVAADVSVGAAVWKETTASDTGITQLTGDVLAGPGSGSQAATIANNAINQAKMADASVGTAELIDGSVTYAKQADDVLFPRALVIARSIPTGRQLVVSTFSVDTGGVLTVAGLLTATFATISLTGTGVINITGSGVFNIAG